MTDLNKEIDEKAYLKGCTLNEALIKYCSPLAVQNYKLALNTPKANSHSSQDTKTFLGFLTTTTETIQNLQNQKDKLKNATDALYREIIDLIRNGSLIPYSYKLPRNLSDPPIRVPIDIFMAGNINWGNSELIYKNFEFTSIRLIEPIPNQLANIPLGKSEIQNHLKEDNSLKGIPKGTLKEIGLKEDIKNNSNKSFADLDPELHIDEKRASEYLGISPRTLQGYRTKGGGPEFIKINHKVVRYKIADLIKWTEIRKRKNTSNHE